MTNPEAASIGTSRVISLPRCNVARLKPLSCRRIGDPISVDLRERRETMLLRFPGTDDVDDADAPDEESIGQQRSVAPPRQSFRAHDGGAGVACEMKQVVERRSEFGGGHTVCVTAESRLSLAAQVLEVLVGNAPFLQASGQVPLRGPRDSLRDRVVADVREELDSVLQKEGDERIEGSSGVANCPDGGP